MDSEQGVRQQAGTVGDNPVRLDAAKAESVVEALNLDFAAALVLSQQFRKHAWSLDGRQFAHLSRFCRDAADDLTLIVDDLARRIRALGGVPVSSPAGAEHHSPIPFEGEDIYGVERSLENDLRACGDLIEQVSSHVELAQGYGDHATAELLRRHLLVLEEYARAIDRYLSTAD